MKIFTLKKEIVIPVSISQAWSFFSDPRNLEIITPPEMNFKILTKDLPRKIYEGLLIDYSVTPLFGIKTKWISEIVLINEPYFFIDEQVQGPYSSWAHKHFFEEAPGGTIMKDEVQYSLPFSFLGILSHQLFVENKLNAIFNYRTEIIEKIFKNTKNESELYI